MTELSTVYLSIIEYTEPSFECECCGFCYPEGLIIQFNGVDIWHRYSDGHLNGFHPENTIEAEVLAACKKHLEVFFEKQAEESNRNKFLKSYPEAVMARTTEDWVAYNEKLKNGALNQLDRVAACLNASEKPSSELGLLKLIALWLEEYLELDIKIEKTQVRQ